MTFSKATLFALEEDFATKIAIKTSGESLQTHSRLGNKIFDAFSEDANFCSALKASHDS
jgi:hypothetical protein